jgi:multicomponent Na+:H+ antiporter subunit B
MSEPLLAALLALLLILALLAVTAADLLVAAVALGSYGFVLALIWAALGAVDVAFTEAVVGAGATTVFFLAALLRTSRRRSPLPSRLRWGALAVTVLTGVAVAAAARGLPPWGDPGAPASVHVSPRYLQRTLEDTATPNAVTAVLADYRGYDTLVETLVIVTAGLGCWLLLRRDAP